MNPKSKIRKVLFNCIQAANGIHDDTEAHQRLYDAITDGKPLMVARFGAVEIKGTLYKKLPPPINKCLHSYVYSTMHTNAGFFPLNEDSLAAFARLMTNDMSCIDVLASWRPEEIFFRHRLAGAWRMRLGVLGPCPIRESWSRALKGKHVLVIHPFSETIKRQYAERRDKIWGEMSDYVLPEFASLQTVKAVQTVAGNTGGYASWFDALEHMKQETDKLQFDVALIGCGAYGLPLAAHIKRTGRQAIHIGGSLQLYFGIRGKRWDDRGIYNEYWTSPDETEKPSGLTSVEGGCYW